MKSQRLDKLEAVRGFAAMYVVFFHLLPQKIYLFGLNVGYLFRFGSEAVIVFFVLSGFVINYTYSKSNDKSFKIYFSRRFVRVYIPLLFIFLLAYLIKCLSVNGVANPEWKILIGNLFMLQDVISQKPNVIVPSYMANGVLWSLSYEWWFYMLFFFLATKFKGDNLNKAVYVFTIFAALSYLIYPFIVNRVIMYFAIWWVGVIFSDLYIQNKAINFKSIKPITIVLFIIISILSINMALNFSYTKVYSYPLVAYPFIELRNFIFAIIVMFGAIIWKNLKWIGFDLLIGKFKYFAPFSYVIYISHHYLVIEASYLHFLNNVIIEHTLYILIMLTFSYLLEVIVYNRIKNLIIRK